MQAGSRLPTGLGLARGKACIARSLLLGSECGLPFRLLGSLTDEFRGGTLPCSKSFSLAFGLGCKTGYFPLTDPHVSRLNDGLSGSLPREDRRIVSCGACPEPGECGLPRLGGRLKTIDELVGFELTHVHSLYAPRLSRGGEKQMKPLLRGSGFETRQRQMSQAQAA